MNELTIDKVKELNIDIDTVDSLPSLYGLQDFEEEAINNVVKALKEYMKLWNKVNLKTKDKNLILFKEGVK